MSLPRSAVGAAAADVAAVVVFVLVGRSSHAEADSLGGAATTAWPFLAALVMGWALGRAWRTPTSLRTGLVVWAVTVLLGHGLRLLAGQGSAWSFLVVTAVVLGLFLIGWRALVAFLVGRQPGRASQTVRPCGEDHATP